MHTVHGLGQEMSMEPCLAPHLFEESKNFLRRNLPEHNYEQSETKRNRRGARVQPTRFLGSAISRDAIANKDTCLGAEMDYVSPDRHAHNPAERACGITECANYQCDTYAE